MQSYRVRQVFLVWSKVSEYWSSAIYWTLWHQSVGTKYFYRMLITIQKFIFLWSFSLDSGESQIVNYYIKKCTTINFYSDMWVDLNAALKRQRMIILFIRIKLKIAYKYNSNHWWATSISVVSCQYQLFDNLSCWLPLT